MTYRNESSDSATKTSHSRTTLAVVRRQPTALIKSTVCASVMLLTLVATSMAAELPEAPSSSLEANSVTIEVTAPVQGPKIAVANPEKKPIDSKFVSLALVSTGSTFADSYTTLFARQNWLARKKGVCNVEVQSAYLYGTHPTVGRAYAVASMKSAGSLFAAYYLRKHHNKFWSLPLVANSIVSLQGVGQNMATCN
jgi:hypothetical protein